MTRTTFVAIFLMLGLAACASAQYSTVWAQPPGTPGLAPSQLSTDAPIDLIGETYVTDFHEEAGSRGLSSYWADIDPVSVSAEMRYWVSVQMLSRSTSEGEWFWAQTSEEVVFEHPRIEDARLSADRWTAFPDPAGYPGNWDFDLAFELEADETPVAKTNRGTIKALYR